MYPGRISKDDVDSQIYFTLIIVGDGYVGKTSFINRYAIDQMEPLLTRLTLYFLTRVTELDGKQIKLRLWDTHGQDHFRSLTRSYFRGADGVVVAYSITDQASFDHLTGWLEELTEYASADINKVLIATKCDLAAERVVDYTTGKEFADSLGIPFFETSAKESTNVQTAFEALARQIFDRKLRK